MAETIAKTFMFYWILKFGVLDSIITDQGTNFVSELMTQLCQLLRVKQLRTTTRHQQGNGQHDNWDLYLLYVCAAYNSQVHTSTQMSPYEVLHGMKMSTSYEDLTVPPAAGNSRVVELARKLHDVWKSGKQRNHATFLQQAVKYNKKVVHRQYKVSDLVYLSNPVCSPVTLKLQLPFCSIIIHVNRVKSYTCPATLLASATDDQDRPRRRPDHVSCVQPRLQLRSHDIQLRLQILLQQAPIRKQQNLPLPISHRHWRDHPSPTTCIVFIKKRVKPSNVFEHESDVVVYDIEYRVVVNFYRYALFEECHLLGNMLDFVFNAHKNYHIFMKIIVLMIPILILNQHN
ncbi:hypothetical protein PR048_027021 [Dryococelus australis]|uniref:Integrase catalytic domain-containing protein n=1 Tax=Dryococelus australis TaxID=614101 RepID=A0ABQ9GMZ8_9NEOP|nr:hypothetical protein PR048_027021 [Dryococelus australis]